MIMETKIVLPRCTMENIPVIAETGRFLQIQTKGFNQLMGSLDTLDF